MAAQGLRGDPAAGTWPLRPCAPSRRGSRLAARGSRSASRWLRRVSVLRAADAAGSATMRYLLVLLVAASAVIRSDASANLGGVPSKRLKMQYATGPLLKFQICVS